MDDAALSEGADSVLDPHNLSVNPSADLVIERFGDLLNFDFVDQVADTTVRCLLRAVPVAVSGITFLSGGQSGKRASARLNVMKEGNEKTQMKSTGKMKYAC
jgi:fructose-bisphosphate aldolase class 1